jgi:hypothetical protein
MYYDEAHHQGRPHFHATYSEDEATIDIERMAIIAGGLPSRGRQLVIEWARAHEQELRENWSRARRNEPLQRIDPLR